MKNKLTTMYFSFPLFQFQGIFFDNLVHFSPFLAVQYNLQQNLTDSALVLTPLNKLQQPQRVKPVVLSRSQHPLNNPLCHQHPEYFVNPKQFDSIFQFTAVKWHQTLQKVPRL